MCFRPRAVCVTRSQPIEHGIAMSWLMIQRQNKSMGMVTSARYGLVTGKERVVASDGETKQGRQV